MKIAPWNENPSCARARFYRNKATTARRIEKLIREMKPGDFAALRTLISEGVNDGRTRNLR